MSAAATISAMVPSRPATSTPGPHGVKPRWGRPGRSHPVPQRTAIGATVEPVPPLSLSGCIMKANSYTRFAASSSSFKFSSRWMPFTTSMIWWTGRETCVSGSGDIDQHPARDEGADVLDAQLGETGSGGQLIDLEAVVQAVLDRLVGEAVELGAHLADLRGDELLVAAAPVRLRVHERSLGVHVEAAGAGDRHLGGEHVAQLDHLAGANQPSRPQHGFGLHVIARAPLVAGPPLRRAALVVGGRPPGLSVSGDARRAERHHHGDADGHGSHGLLLCEGVVLGAQTVP